MPPSPEKAEIQPRPTGGELGVGLEVRVKSPTWEVGVGAVLQDFTPGEVILLLDDPITAQTQVAVQVNTCSFQGEILYCQPSGSRWEAHVSFDDVDASGLRRSPRFPVRIPARLYASGGPTDAMILDISGEGLGVEMGRAVAAQTNVAVQSEDAVALGHVRHCREIAPGVFRAGILLQHIMKRDSDLVRAAESGWMNRLGLGRKKGR